MAHYLVTGANGFVGRNLIPRLLAAGHQVTGVYRQSPPLLPSESDLTLVQRDLADLSTLNLTPDFIVHTAATTQADTAWAFLDSNVITTRHVVNFAAQCRVRGLFYLSTISIHGQISSAHIDRDTPRHNPDLYGQSKYLGERVIADFAATVPSLSIRLPGIIGPGASGVLITRLAELARQGKPLIISNPEALFNGVVHVADLAAFIMAAGSGFPKGASCLPLGSSPPLSLYDLAMLIAQYGGARSSLTIAQTGTLPALIDLRPAMALGYQPRSVAEVVTAYLQETGRSHVDQNGPVNH